MNGQTNERTMLFDDIHEAVILKLRRLYGYEAVSNFIGAVI